MKHILRTIWDSQFLFFLSLVFIGGIYLLVKRPDVKSKSDLIEINGTLKSVDQVLVYFKKIKKTENDSTYHIRLNEFPCFFQVSYKKWDSKSFSKNAKYGDRITFNISKNDLESLFKFNERVRTFSIKSNDKVYLSVDSGLKGFGKGYFEYSVILIPLILLIIIVSYRLKK
ncbi:hypothetical protein [Acidiluteibacter ferrifornacis]|uniref:Uncharacterized protein n=1 Tax=Acidiluteibacter ferrifornacis TaxID=2692424 RepID=A0A6N9NL97_9FLAO|nr:hypothetical protein [Acidiluteibacter ferrifornacis]NBG67478.1 hypothetical protein [Acidiluteibacter ferrifornacis]